MNPAEVQDYMPIAAQALSNLITEGGDNRAENAIAIANFLNILSTGYCAMHEAVRAPDNTGEPEAWIVDPETIFVWGTHDPARALELASPLWADEFRPEEKDIARAISEGSAVWLHPSLTQESEWHPSLVSHEMIFGWVPMLVINL